MVVGTLVLPLLFLSFISIVHYQDRVSDMNQKITDGKQFLAQKDVLATRLMDVERSVSRTEQSIKDLEGILDVEVGSIKSGVGPLEVGDNLLARPGELRGLADIEDESLPDFHAHVSELGKRVEELQFQLEELYDLNQDRIRFLNAFPDDLPVSGWVTSGFGFRRSPYNGRHQMHYGVDIASPMGLPITAPADGRIVLAEMKPGYGRKVVIDHGYGITTVFGHASQFFVKSGEKVKRGDKIAAVGSSGSSTGPHLHYEIHVDGLPIDPLKYLQ